MRVRMKIGPKAGEVVDLIYHAARTLVEAGQAEDVDDQMRLPKAKVERIDSVSLASGGMVEAPKEYLVGSHMPADSGETFPTQKKKRK